MPRLRLGLPGAETTGYRLVHAEGDGLPGLIVDRFGDVLAVQLLTIGMKRREGLVLEALERPSSPRAILDRTPASSGKAEGFTPEGGVVRGDEIDALTFTERGLRFRVPLELGQKTGFYFDQRPLRARVEQLARGARVLDAFASSVAFALAAARGGATRGDGRRRERARAARSAPSAPRARTGSTSAIEFVKAGRAQGPRRGPRGASTSSSAIRRGSRPRAAPGAGARRLRQARRAACRAARRAASLVFCSCSAAVDLDALTRALAAGAPRANVQATVFDRQFQGADHPVPAAFPEGLYLKALIARVGAAA